VASTNAPRKWHAAPDLVWTQFDDSDDWVVYDPASDDVHLLTSSAYHLWNLVRDGESHTVDELATTLATMLSRAPDAELMAATRDTLASLDEVGLVRPATE
jgi:PqqD family protein of HPr-rel-A system